MTCRARGLFSAVFRRRVTPGLRQVALAKAGRHLAFRGIKAKDIVREVHRRYYIHYPSSTIFCFLAGLLQPQTLAYRVIKHTIQEAFGIEIIHGTSLQPGEPATQGKEV
ncbi:MAG: hypothetical protein J3T61_05515 [Candidatus Brocadiales bacterium]|nr:hypothetical protein [Candidatus Bathyanammoxibius sp.]